MLAEDNARLERRVRELEVEKEEMRMVIQRLTLEKDE